MADNSWSSRAKSNLYLLLRADKIHKEIEEERKLTYVEAGAEAEYEFEFMKIKPFVPWQAMLDEDKELLVKGFDTKAMTMCVLQESTKVDGNLQIYLSLGDIILFAICGDELQKRLLRN